jgi:hypothetical protein
MRFLKLFAVIFLLAGCAALMTQNGKIFNMGTGEVMAGKIQRGLANNGKITAVSASGEKFEGDYRLKDDNTLMLQMNGTLEKSKLKNGTCLLAGDKGTIIDLKFQFDPSNNSGKGEGKDNKGASYKIEF